MVQIENSDRVVEIAGRWMPSDIAFIEAFCYTAQTESHPSKVVLTVLLQRRDQCKNGWPASDMPMYQVMIEFSDVRRLHVKDVSTNAMQVMGFDIIDAADRGWEDVGLEIEDYENGRIGFLCATARVVSVAKVPSGM